MNWMDKLERKFGRYTIPNITRYFVFANLVGYFISLINENLLLWFTFDPASICRGQIWRLITWVFVPSSGLSFWTLLFIVCLLMLGQNLEYSLGSFRMNLYFWGGILLSDVGGMLVYLIWRVPIYLTLYYVLFSLYLMLGLFMPDAEVRLYFVLPIRMKWLMLLYAVELTYEVYSYFKFGYSYGNSLGAMGMQFAIYFGVMYSAQIVLALLNLFIFVYSCKRHISRRHRKRQREFRSQFQEARPGSGIVKHKCAICGRTEKDDPTLVFRFCSKCAGNYEYCQEHLFTHEHIHLS